MGDVRDQSERLLHGRADPAFHPFTPLFQIERLTDRAAFVSSFANVLAVDTDEGLVLVDVGSFFLAKPTKDLVRSFSDKPLHTAVYTHGHLDHVFGVAAYEEESGKKARVVGHRAIADRFDRYKLTAGYNACINARQFQVETPWPTDYRYPDVVFDDRLVLDVGGERIELEHARGETDDHTFVFLPSQKILATGDLFIWATPNAGNPQKVQRYPGDWARALRKMVSLDAEILSPGHGPPIFGKDAVRLALTETAELLEHLVKETICRMNEGASLDAVLSSVKAPKHLCERPYLRPIYDEPEFIVRNVWRQLGGWWDGNPARLKPGPDSALARELTALAGGTAPLVARAEALSASGEHALASHLVETAFQASPEDREVRAARARIYRARADAETSLMAKGIFTTAAKETE